MRHLRPEGVLSRHHPEEEELPRPDCYQTGNIHPEEDSLLSEFQAEVWSLPVEVCLSYQMEEVEVEQVALPPSLLSLLHAAA